MISQFLSALGNFAAAIYRAFLFPGEVLLSLLSSLAPDTVAILTFGHGAVIMLWLLALLAWTALAVVGLLLLNLCKNFARQTGAFVRTILFRLSMWLSGLRMRIVWKFRSMLPRRKIVDDNAAPMIEFDDIDLAVLRTASAQGPGFALSAPELAEKFTMRPAQVQRSLDRLRQNKMLDSVIGSTDGYDNYRLTDSGFAFLAMLQRQQART